MQHNNEFKCSFCDKIKTNILFVDEQKPHDMNKLKIKIVKGTCALKNER